MLDIMFFIIIPLLILIIIFILWIKYGKDSKLNKKISKNPPKLNNILFGYYYRGFINENDIKASLISLIIRGYLNNKNEILKKYDDLDRIDKVILNYISNNKIINNSKLIDEINKNLIIKNDIDNVFEEQSLSKKSSCKFLIFLMYLIIIIKALIHIKKLKYLIIILPLNLIGLKIMISLFDNKKIKYNLLGFIFGLLLIILPLRFLVINKLIGIYKILFIISLIILYLMIILYILMPKRTKKSSKILNQILGFKQYIENINEVDEKYYYEVLPYSYNLDLYSYWKKKDKFKKIVDF